MRIATVTAEGRGATDWLLGVVATRLIAEGRRPVGAIRAPASRPMAESCDMDLKVLPDGPVVRISQDLGRGASACRLDAAALEEVVGLAGARLDGLADLFILNKFGLSEAEGRGFRPIIAAALDRGLPVLLGLSETHRASFDVFAGGSAVALPADAEAILDWCRAAAEEHA